MWWTRTEALTSSRTWKVVLVQTRNLTLGQDFVLETERVPKKNGKCEGGDVGSGGGRYCVVHQRAAPLVVDRDIRLYLRFVGVSFLIGLGVFSKEREHKGRGGRGRTREERDSSQHTLREKGGKKRKH
jgi:hypothetical protein